jgi:Tfp pilus assembly protein PilX
MIHRIVQRLVREEKGVALVMALAMMAVLSIMTAGVLLAGTANESTSYVSDQQREAFEIAQQGLAYAEGMLDYNTAHGVAVSVGTAYAQPTQPVGSGTYAVQQSSGNTYLVGTGTVGPFTRTVKDQVAPALDVEVILDTSGSMQSACTGSVTGVSSPEKIDCAKAGMQALLQGLWPCYSTLSSCGAATANSGELGANVTNAVDEVGLIAFPALSSISSRPYEIDCNSSDSFAVTYPNPPSGNQPGYNIVGLSSDYRPSDVNTTLNSTSNIVEAVNWAQCPGTPGTYSGSSNGAAMASGTSYFSVSAAAAGSATATANTTTTSQTETLTGLTFDPSGTASGLSYTATVGVVSGATWTATALTCTSSGGNPCTISGSISEPSGTKLNLKVVSSGSGATRTGTWTVSYTGPPGQYPGGDYYGLKVVGGQGSYLAGAINHAQYALSHAGRPGVTNVIIVLSDGALNSPHSWTDNTPCNTANNAATAAKNAGTLIYSIAYDSSGGNCTDTTGTFHNASGTTLMSSVASSSNTFINQPNPGALTTTFTHIAGDLNGLHFIG